MVLAVLRRMGAVSMTIMRRTVVLVVVVVVACSMGARAFEWADCLQADECDDKVRKSVCSIHV